MNKTWLVYDERAWSDPDDALVLVSCDSAQEAASYAKDETFRGVVYEYDVDGDRLINGRLVSALSYLPATEKPTSS